MAIPLTRYNRIKDRYCIGYFGQNKNIYNQLKAASALIETQLPGIKIFICCMDNLFDHSPNVIRYSELQDWSTELAYFRELPDTDNCVTVLLKESGIV